VTDRPAMDRFSLVLLRRPPDPPELSDEESDALQERHLAHLRAMRARGAMATAGPFRDQQDESLRGLCLYRTSLEEARELAGQDPAVRAGRLAVDVLTWLAPAGEVRFGSP
jgi:uncharacterized protein YciI